MVDEVDKGTGEGEKQQQVEISPIEQKALDLGWRPKEEFDGDEADFIDAKEYVQRQPLFDKIAQQSKHIKNVDKALKALQSHYSRVNENAYKKAVEDLKKQQEVAVQDGDLNTYHALNQRREEIENEKQQFMQEQEAIQEAEPQVHPVMQAWVARNSWYETQPHMRVFAEEIGSRFKGAVMAKTMTPEDVLKEVEKAVRAEFPNKFRNPNKDKAPVVEGSSGRSGRKSDDNVELTEQEQTIMKTLVRGGHITKEKYLADIKELRAKERG
jgi:hypothetical protein